MVAAGLAGADQNRHLEGGLPELHAHHVAVHQRQGAGVGFRHMQGVAPDLLGERLGAFLQPGIVGETAVPDRWVGLEHERERRGRRRPARAAAISAPAPSPAATRFRPRSRSPASRATSRRNRPARTAPTGSSPRLPHEIVGRSRERAGEQREQLVRGAGVVKRPDQRLHDAGGALESAQIRPALERVGQRQMPLAARARLVVMEAQTCAERHRADGLAEISAPGPS